MNATPGHQRAQVAFKQPHRVSVVAYMRVHMREPKAAIERIGVGTGCEVLTRLHPVDGGGHLFGRLGVSGAARYQRSDLLEHVVGLFDPIAEMEVVRVQ